MIVSLAHGSTTATCGLTADGSVYCFDAMVFEREPDAKNLRGAKILTVSLRHSCVADAAGIASCWGQNGTGQLGDGKPVQNRDTILPVQGLPAVTDIQAAWERTCALTKAGDVHCWGDRSWGKAGDGTLIDENRSEAIKALPGARTVGGAIAIAVSSEHTCAVLSDGSVTCWGGNLNGETGAPRAHPPGARPAKVANVRGVVAIAAGSLSTCVIDAAGAVQCWGGRLGKQTSVDPRFGNAHPLPRAFPLPGPAAQVVVGSELACARLRDGHVHCSGQNDAGALGDGTTTDRDTPGNALALPEPAIDLMASHDSVCALTSRGRVFCWGKDRLVKPTERADDALVPVEVGPPES